MNTADPLRDPRFIQAVLDTIVPPDRERGMPGAGALGLDGAVAAAVAADERSSPLMAEALGALSSVAFAALPPGERAAAMRAVFDRYPGALDALCRHVYLAYYQHPEVLQAIGEPARPPFPEGFTVAPTDPDLLASLEARRRR